MIGTANYLPDEKMQGRCYVSVLRVIRKINILEHRVVLTGGISIPIDDLLAIERQPPPAEH